MTSAFFTGFFLGLSLIIAIGAQNAFVIQQGVLRQYVFYIALFCSISDSLLISLGVLGASFFLDNFFNEFEKIIFGLSSLWLFLYGTLRLISAFKSSSNIILDSSQSNSLKNTISITAIFTFGNPHVYLDTMILIGSISQKFTGQARISFAIGACIASFVWFFGIAYGAKTLTPFMKNKLYWRLLDAIIALIMFIIAYNLAIQGNWI
jgi:L-lysine exporter family protein LysE/ArgO